MSLRTKIKELERHASVMDGRSDAAVAVSQLLLTQRGWVLFFVYTFQGENYEYLVEDIAPGTATEREAERSVKAKKALHRAQGAFLRDVALNEEVRH